MNFKINFQLQEIDKIIPWGYDHDFMSWFGLTDGLLWIDIGNNTIYEYSQAAREYWKRDEKYNDYQLSRFLEDFSETFYLIRESIPESLYNNIDKFTEYTHNWINQYIDEPDDLFDKFYDEEYEPLTEWFSNRIFDSGHLTGGPLIGCFRHEDRIKIYWNSDYTLDNGNSIWASPKGIVELKYEDFIIEVERFFHLFFMAMDKQVELAVLKDWGKVKLDKDRLVSENSDRKIGFRQAISMLSSQSDILTDWSRVKFLYEKMMKSFDD